MLLFAILFCGRYGIVLPLPKKKDQAESQYVQGWVTRVRVHPPTKITGRMHTDPCQPTLYRLVLAEPLTQTGSGQTSGQWAGRVEWLGSSGHRLLHGFFILLPVFCYIYCIYYPAMKQKTCINIDSIPKAFFLQWLSIIPPAF